MHMYPRRTICICIDITVTNNNSLLFCNGLGFTSPIERLMYDSVGRSFHVLRRVHCLYVLYTFILLYIFLYIF